MTVRIGLSNPGINEPTHYRYITILAIVCTQESNDLISVL